MPPDAGHGGLLAAAQLAVLVSGSWFPHQLCPFLEVLHVLVQNQKVLKEHILILVWQPTHTKKITLRSKAKSAHLSAEGGSSFLLPSSSSMFEAKHTNMGESAHPSARAVCRTRMADNGRVVLVLVTRSANTRDLSPAPRGAFPGNQSERQIHSATIHSPQHRTASPPPATRGVL